MTQEAPALNLNATLNAIGCHREEIDAAQREEREARRRQNSKDVAACNLVNQLAKDLKAALGDGYAMRLTSELVKLTGWKSPVAVSKDPIEG